MKRYIALFFALCCLAVLTVGCSQKTADTNKDASSIIRQSKDEESMVNGNPNASQSVQTSAVTGTPSVTEQNMTETSQTNGEKAEISSEKNAATVSSVVSASLENENNSLLQSSSSEFLEGLW